MPIRDLQRRGRQLGEIRTGIVTTNKDGKPMPAKLEAFRFTTKSPSVAKAVADLHGGSAEKVKLQNDAESWQVITNATQIPVMVPPGDNVISQWYELYTKSGCARRCDGYKEYLSGDDCMCPSDQDERRKLAAGGSACKPTTRLNVMLPDLPDLGVWLLASHGFNAAVELGGAAEVLSAARNQGVTLAATLRLEKRESRKAGEQVKKFVVPVLEIGATLRQMTELQSGDIGAALPLAPTQALGTGDDEEIENLWDYLRERIQTPDERERLRKEQWADRYAFPITRVPRSQVDDVKRLIHEHATKTDDDIVDAEIVDESGPHS